jgi:hypothetical protein
MQQRRGTSEQWSVANPVLGTGEIGFETNTNRFKIGDGVNTWANLDYFLDETALEGSLGDYVLLDDVGQPDGVASLDAQGQVPLSQLGNAPDPDLSAYATTQYVDDAIENVVGLAPSQLDTLAEIADALGDNANFLSGIATDIADAEQAAKDYADTQIAAIPPVDISGKQDKVTGVSDIEIGYLDGVTSAIQTQLDGKAASSHTHLVADITDYNRADGVVLSATAPSSPVSGLKWIDTTNMIEYVYYNSTWVEI